jgi:hypothetical protein
MPSCSNLQDSNLGASPLTEPILETRMSPCTVATTLANFANLDTNVLQGICKGLCETLETHAADHAAQTGALQECVQTLEGTLKTHANNCNALSKALQECVKVLEQQLDHAAHPSPNNVLEGFKTNNGLYPMLYITVVPNEMQPTYWIQECSDSKVLGRYQGQPANKDPWVFEVYVQLLLDLEHPITAIPSWY